MASLKEIKGRIGSVESTLKITSAMKMVASAKLHKAQQAIESMLPYDRQLHQIMADFLCGDVKVSTPLSEVREVKRVAIVAIASNSSLCGGYNANMVRQTLKEAASYASLGADNVTIYVIGRKLEQALTKAEGTFTLNRDFLLIGENPKFQDATSLSNLLIQQFQDGLIDRVELLYMHFKSTGSQILTHEAYLPVVLDTQAQSESKFIVEPSAEEIMMQLVPNALHMKVYTCMLDAQASEHAARTVAMQTASDNANDLLGDLRVMYNKGRQQAITAELLDIVGGSMQ